MDDFIKIVGALVVFVFVIAVAGLANIWALNTLFPSLAIPYTFWTWCASFILMGTISYNRKKN
jgi:hypothetical protein